MLERIDLKNPPVLSVHENCPESCNKLCCTYVINILNESKIPYKKEHTSDKQELLPALLLNGRHYNGIYSVVPKIASLKNT